MILAATKLLLTLLILAADAFYLLSLFAAFKFFSEKTDRRDLELPPVTIMVPLSGAEFEAYENYARFCRQDYPAYQIVFGVRDPADPAVPIVEKLIADFPACDVELVVSPRVTGQNLKVSNLQNMLGRVKHERIIIVDSDIRVGTDYLRRVVPELADERVGLVTCLYRAARAEGLAARLEAIGITAEFHPGVLTARLVEGVKFALGSTMATSRARLESIGGFPALADYLADDFLLGHLIAGQGYEVRISHYTVETQVAQAGFRAMMRHQMRWARSTRISRPLGYLGLILTYGTALAFVNLAVARASAFSLALLAVTLVVRSIMAWMIGVHWLKDEVLRRHFWLLPARDILSFVIWCLSWFGTRVEWRGRRFRIARDGKMVEVDRVAARQEN